ncbi:MAG: hypothetical protein V4724_21970 [Pseudomonadota bacterium]
MKGFAGTGAHRLWLLLATCLPAQAAELAERLDTTLTLRTDAWSGSRQLDDTGGIVQTAAWGRLALDLGEGGGIVASGWRGDRSGAHVAGPRGRVRELYWRDNLGPLELKLGRQLVVWGRADGVNPTDNLSPRDFTQLAPDDGDQRYGNEVAQLRLNTGIGSVSALWFPHAASHTLPLPAQPNLRYTVQAPRASQWGIKWETVAEGVDGSISYFHGIDPMPDLALSGVDESGASIAVRNHPARVLGADISFTRGAIVWRAEAAAMQTGSGGSADFMHKKPQLWLVAGGEYGLDNGTTVGLQATILQVKNFLTPDSIADPLARAIAWRQAATSNQTSTSQKGITWHLARRWWNDTLMAETSGMLVWPSGSGIWRTKIDYAIDDRWHMQAGSDHYFGPKNSFFGQLGKNRLMYVQLRYGW